MPVRSFLKMNVRMEREERRKARSLQTTAYRFPVHQICTKCNDPLNLIDTET